jgi:hypothetical protein
MRSRARRHDERRAEDDGGNHSRTNAIEHLLAHWYNAHW